ncbi:MAG: hypothetical protein ACYTEL_09140 [Planctomycetota bacterium]
MTFGYEYEMVGPAERWLRSEGLFVKREFPTPWGICDLVGCSFNRENVNKRLALGQRKPIGPTLRVRILSLIPEHDSGRSITLRRLTGKFNGWLGEERVALEVERLVKGKFVKKTSRRGFQRFNGWVPLHKRLVAVELKLRRVTEAFYQARGHLGFADESYVGLPLENAQRLLDSKKKLEFVREGVGVLAVEQGGCEVLLESTPDRARPDEVLQIHSAERFWRTYARDIGP